MTLPIPALDLASLVVFCLLWLGYGAIVTRFGRHAINNRLGHVRALWMTSALARDNRITDASLIGLVVHSASFFASTTLVAVGALFGLLPGVDRLQAALANLSLAAPASRTLLEWKVLLPLAVLVQGLFKFTWAIRQLNYTVALIGAMPPAPVHTASAGRLATATGAVLSGALATFNDGIRAYYFAIASLAWFAGPIPLAVAAILLMALLIYRQVGSGVSRHVRAALEAADEAHARRTER
jgi:uncharacterized membrane protein